MSGVIHHLVQPPLLVVPSHLPQRPAASQVVPQEPPGVSGSQFQSLRIFLVDGIPVTSLPKSSVLAHRLGFSVIEFGEGGNEPAASVGVLKLNRRKNDPPHNKPNVIHALGMVEGFSFPCRLLCSHPKNPQLLPTRGMGPPSGSSQSSNIGESPTEMKPMEEPPK